MSASGRMAKKVELKRKWEDSLKDYKEPILYARSVLTWQRPIDFGIFVVVLTLSLWLYFSIETTVVTLVSLLVVFWTVASWLTTVTALRFPWHLLLRPQDSSSVVDHFGDVIGFFVQVRYAVVDTVEDMQRFKAANPTRFVLQIVVSGLLLAYLGSFISGQSLLLIITYTLLVLPGAVANGVLQRVAAIAEPHVKVYREKLGVLLSGIMQQVDQQLKKAKNVQPSTTNTPSTSSSVASASTAAPQEEIKEEVAKKDD